MVEQNDVPVFDRKIFLPRLMRRSQWIVSVENGKLIIGAVEYPEGYYDYLVIDLADLSKDLFSVDYLERVMIETFDAAAVEKAKADFAG